MVEPRTLRVALLQEGVLASEYTRDVLLWLRQQDNLELSHLITYGGHKDGERVSRGVMARAALQLIERVEQSFLRRYRGGMYRNHCSLSPVDDLIANTLALRPAVSGSGVHDFSEADVEKVRATGADVLVHAGQGAVPVELAGVSRHGIVSLQYGDREGERRGPPGFWEAYLARPSSGFSIRRLTAVGEEVLLQGAFDTRWFFLLNQAELFSKSSFFFKDVLRRLSLDGALPKAEEMLPISGLPPAMPTLSDCLGYVLRLAGRTARRLMQRLSSRVFGYQDRWHLFFNFSDWRQANLRQATTVVSPPGRFLADPFVWQHNGRTYCLAEDYSFGERIGRISAFEIGASGTTEPELVLVEPFHLSFPYLFEFEGAIFMCPECSASRQIRMYRSVEFPRRWEFVKTIMTDVSAVDTMLFEKEDRWWMLTNLDLAGRGGLRSELYLFSATSPLSDSWVPHPSNPIKLDPEGGRNAGLLRDGHRVFRAGQVQGFERYGAGVRLYEITSLSPDRYEERFVTEILPSFRRRLLGTHHISSTGTLTVVDGYVREVV